MYIFTCMAVVRNIKGKNVRVAVSGLPMQEESTVPDLKYSFDAHPNMKDKSLMEKAGPFLVIVVIVMAFFLGSLWTKVSMLEKGSGTTNTQTTTTTGTQPAAQQGQQAPNVSLSTIKGLFNQDLIKFGDANKKLLFVEVADPSCPYCQAASGQNPELNNQIGPQFKLISNGGTYDPPVVEMKKLVDQGKAGFIYIFMPGHGNGEMGMKALYCAFDAGKFWQVENLLNTSAGYDLLNNQIKNDKTKSAQLASFLAAAVDPTTLQKCVDSGKYDTRLSTDSTLATQTLGVNGTPGFYINATLFPGAFSFKDMQSAVDAALK